MGQPFVVNDAVRWVSSNTPKEGVIVGVVPAGRLPCDVGFKTLGDTALSRDHESYVVRGQARGRAPTMYWPLVSLLHRAVGLTADEVAWCHKHASRIRALMSGER
jgi:hypothetical protein